MPIEIDETEASEPETKDYLSARKNDVKRPASPGDWSQQLPPIDEDLSMGTRLKRARCTGQPSVNVW
jgi:hypothetical protein